MSCLSHLILYPHPVTPCAAVQSLQVVVEYTKDDGLCLQYRLSGDLAQIRIPEPQTPAFTDGLWEHTCFEVFIGVQGENGYREFNFSPSRQWAAYAFNGYRKRVEWNVSTPPLLTVTHSADGAGDFELQAIIGAVNLPAKSEGKLFEVGLTAVIETLGGQKSYWALAHSAEQPDFHLRNSFTAKI